MLLIIAKDKKFGIILYNIGYYITIFDIVYARPKCNIGGIYRE